jgi:hypothetical protein
MGEAHALWYAVVPAPKRHARRGKERLLAADFLANLEFKNRTALAIPDTRGAPAPTFFN